MERGKLRQDALQLSVKLVCLYDVIDKKAFLKNQLARAGTSIGANIHEADYAESPTDFIHKLKIALKECHETEYWLHVLAATCPELGCGGLDALTKGNHTFFAAEFNSLNDVVTAFCGVRNTTEA